MRSCRRRPAVTLTLHATVNPPTVINASLTVTTGVYATSCVSTVRLSVDILELLSLPVSVLYPVSCVLYPFQRPIVQTSPRSSTTNLIKLYSHSQAYRVSGLGSFASWSGTPFPYQYTLHHKPTNHTESASFGEHLLGKKKKKQSIGCTLETDMPTPTYL